MPSHDSSSGGAFVVKFPANECLSHNAAHDVNMSAKRSARPSTGMPTIGPGAAAVFLRELRERGQAMLDQSSSTPISESAYSPWCLLVRNRLEQAFGANTNNVIEFIALEPGGVFGDSDERWWEKWRKEALAKQLPLLDAMVELLVAEDKAISEHPKAHGTTQRGTDIFIVHGRDEGIKAQVARFLQQLVGADPIILHEQPDNGRSVIEKLEQTGEIPGYAVIIMTADDEGRLKGEDLQPRARQNVVFELGYFIAKVGRSRIAVLAAPDLEWPTDYEAVISQPLDASGGWKMWLARELRSAGYSINSEALMR